MINKIVDGIKSLFGEGKIRAEISTKDGVVGTVKVEYVGAIDTLDQEEFHRYIVNRIYVETGAIVTGIKILGYY